MENRINEEEVCADSFAQYLQKKLRIPVITLEKVQNDPPDFLFTINGEEFPVEVTSITEKMDYSSKIDLLKRKILESTGAFEGTYLLCFSRYPVLQPHSDAWKNIVSSAYDFITGGQSEEITLWTDASGSIKISRFPPAGNSLEHWHTSEVRREKDILPRLSELMTTALSKKRGQLEKKKFEKSKVILLLYDAFPTPPNLPQKALLQTSDYGWFHSVFWASSFSECPNEHFPDEHGRNGIFLYSCNNNWWIKPDCQ